MKKIALISIWIITIVLVSINIITNPSSFIVNGTIFFGWLLFALQVTWTYSERFYMCLKSIWFNIKNPDCIWNMQIEFNGEFTENAFADIDRIFTTESNNYKVIPLSNERKIYKIDTLTYEVVINPQQIRVEINDLEISFRRSRNIIEKEIGELLERLSQALKEERSNYYLNINFKDYNPYYGFFIRKLDASEIKTFNVKFNIDNEKVSINKKSIELHTTSLHKMTNLSKKYLTLSPR